MQEGKTSLFCRDRADSASSDVEQRLWMCLSMCLEADMRPKLFELLGFTKVKILDALRWRFFGDASQR
jgi:hypothetical protein